MIMFECAAGILPICIKTKRALIGLRSSLIDEPNTWEHLEEK